MSKKITISLNQKSIDSAIKDLKAYQQTLDAKTNELISELEKIGIETIKSIVSEIPYEDKGNDISVGSDGTEGSDGVYKTRIRLSGSKVLFIEFSAGITYGQSDYPLPSGSGFGVGTYPGQKNAFNPDGWYYTDQETGQTGIHSYGNRAYMPVYHASEAIVLQVHDIAKRIFGG